MNRNNIVRILEVIENPQFPEKANVDHFLLAEYLQNTNGGRVKTDRVFSFNQLIEHIEDNLYLGQLFAAQLEMNETTADDIYQFQFHGDCNLKSTNFSNYTTSHLAIVVPGKLKENHIKDEEIEQFNEYLAKETILVNEVASRRNRHEHYKVQKQNHFKVAVAVGTLAAVLISGTVYPYLQQKQAETRKIDIQNMKQYETPTTQELQEQYHKEMDDTEFNNFLEGIREEHEAQRKLP